jgi:hypothetical protein
MNDSPSPMTAMKEPLLINTPLPIVIAKLRDISWTSGAEIARSSSDSEPSAVISTRESEKIVPPESENDPEQENEAPSRRDMARSAEQSIRPAFDDKLAEADNGMANAARKANKRYIAPVSEYLNGIRRDKTVT